MNRCVCCGEIIPEGRQVCHNCENHIADVCKKAALKPCPFCGCEKIEIHLDREAIITRYRAVCWGCSAQMYRGTKEEAAKAWNRRAEDGK